MPTTSQIAESYKQAARRLLLLDYDGTLREFELVPSEAKPSDRLLAALKRLADDPRNKIVLVSGREQHALENWLGHLHVYLVAEHGFFVKPPQKAWKAAAQVNSDWKQGIKVAMQRSVDAVKDSFIEEKYSSLVWHYRRSDKIMAEKELPLLMNRLAPLLKASKLREHTGHENLEVRLNMINKGLAAKPFLHEQAWDFILAAGDDITDEDLFAAVPPGAFTVKIGAGPTKAANHLPDPKSMITFLEMLADS